jgi:hypothetical protein
MPGLPGSVYSNPVALQRRGSLSAPVSYWSATCETRRLNCNGCGTGGWKGTLVPDTVYGLPITEACNIHDWMYAEGVTADDKGEADSLFLHNLLALVESAAKASLFARWIAPLRRRRALKYYEAVSLAGGPAFEAARLVRPVELARMRLLAAKLVDHADRSHGHGELEREAADAIAQCVNFIEGMRTT